MPSATGALPVRAKELYALLGDYAQENWLVVAMRLTQAGHLLGEMLNQILG